MADQEASSRFDKLTIQARNVLKTAQREAELFRHTYIGTEHLLLGLVQEEESGAARVLANLGVDTIKVRSAIAYIIGVGSESKAGKMNLTPQAKKAFELAVEEARNLHHDSIGTEHLLLGLLSEGAVTTVLENLGVNQEEIKTQLLVIFNLSELPKYPYIHDKSSDSIIVPSAFRAEIRKVERLEIQSQGDPRVLPAMIQAYQKILERLQAYKEPLFYAAMYNRMGIAYRLLPVGDHDANLQMAIKCYHEALRFYTPESAPLKYAETQANLGNVYGDLLTEDRVMNLRKAIRCYKEASRFFTPRTAPLAYAKLQNNLGATYLDMPVGDQIAYQEMAIRCFQEALHFRTPETDPLKYAETQNNLGVAYCKLSVGDRAANLKLAIKCFEEVLRFWTPNILPVAWARTLNNLGNAYSNLPTEDRVANLAKAIECYEKALRFLTPEVDPLAYAKTQILLGNAYRVLLTNPAAELLKAIECYEKALRFLTPEADPLAYTGTQYNLGLAYGGLPTGKRTENLTKAIKYLQKALHFQTPETDPFGYAATQNGLGLAYRDLVTEGRMENLAKAIECFQEALRFYTLEADPFKHRMVARSLAEFYFDQGLWEMALSTYRLAIEAGEQLYRVGLSTESKKAEVSENATLYPNAAFAAVHCGQRTEALLILEQGKTRLLTEALRLRVQRPATVPDELWQRFEQAGVQVRSRQAEKNFMEVELHNPIQAYEAHIQAVREANSEFHAAMEAIRRHAPTFLTPLDLSSIESLLPDIQTALITFCVTTLGSVGFVVSRPAQVEIQTVEFPSFTRSDLQNLFIERDAQGQVIEGWFGAYARLQNTDKKDTKARQQAFEHWQQTITHTLTILGERLISPMVTQLSPEITHILFQPAAELFLFPLHAAPLASDPLTLVGDRYQVSYAPSMEVLRNSRTRAVRSGAPSLYLAVNPQVDKPLPFSVVEGQFIAELFEHKQVDREREATKNKVIAGVSEKTYVHFSCHGSYDWENPPMSGIYLADGMLTLADLQQGMVDLSQARLVTLSACETGISDVIKGGPEEYVGVPAGFLVAGVPCVVSSLWAVDDLSTSLLMERFYQNHLRKRMSVADALGEAQKWMRQATTQEMKLEERWHQIWQNSRETDKDAYQLMRHYRSNPELRPYVHPYYWAAFTVNGMDEVLENITQGNAATRSFMDSPGQSDGDMGSVPFFLNSLQDKYAVKAIIPFPPQSYKFTEEAKKVLFLAQDIARGYKHNYIGTEHLILGLIHERGNVAAKILANLGIELNKIREAVEYLISPEDRPLLSEIILTPRAKKIVNFAIDEAIHLNHRSIGTGHLLIGMVREGEGIAWGVLDSLGVSLEKVYTQASQVLGQHGDNNIEP